MSSPERPEAPGYAPAPSFVGSRAYADTVFLVIGAGGHGRVVADLVRAQGASVYGYADADPEKLHRIVEPGGAVVLHLQDALLEQLLAEGRCPDGVHSLALGIGNNGQRLDLFQRLAGFPFPVLAHPGTVVSPSARIGPGTVLVPGCVVNAAAEIGAAAIVNTGATIGHDCVLADGVHVAPGANLCGGAQIGSRTWIGSGAVVVPGVRVGADVMVGAGTVVLRHVPDGVTIVGNPGRIVAR